MRMVKNIIHYVNKSYYFFTDFSGIHIKKMDKQYHTRFRFMNSYYSKLNEDIDSISSYMDDYCWSSLK